MDKFEFIATLMSVIFGLSIANLLSGLIRAFLSRELNSTRMGWSLFVGIVLLTNWWGFFRWSDTEVWHYHHFLLLVAWGTTHYLLAVAIYPYDFLDQITEKLRRNFVLIAMLAVCVMDLVETFLRGELFQTPLYLPFLAYLGALLTTGLVWQRPIVMNALGWILFFSALAWSLLVRAVLES